MAAIFIIGMILLFVIICLLGLLICQQIILAKDLNWLGSILFMAFFNLIVEALLISIFIYGLKFI